MERVSNITWKIKIEVNNQPLEAKVGDILSFIIERRNQHQEHSHRLVEDVLGNGVFVIREFTANEEEAANARVFEGNFKCDFA